MQSLVITCWLGLFVSNAAAMTAIFGMNTSRLRANSNQNPQATSYGKNRCHCVGIDNLKGYYSSQENFHHVQRKAETGASCEAWDKGLHPECGGSAPPQWCSQSWCYVDPCSCNLDVLPKKTKTSVTFQGSPAYWSYDTCGGTDFYSQEMSPDACISQRSEGACSKKSDCAWDAEKEQCGGKEVLETCKEASKKNESEHGEEDCRCVGLSGKTVGKTFMHYSEKDMGDYPPDVGGQCAAWENDVHPDCKEGGEKPSWCTSKWCFVDPCKCKTKTPPKAVMPANAFMRFQGKTAYFSYATCGSEDSWTAAHKGQYCIEQKTQEGCEKMSKCAWNGKECLGKALVDICAKQKETGVLGMEAPLQSGSLNTEPVKALVMILMVFALGTVADTDMWFYIM